MFDRFLANSDPYSAYARATTADRSFHHAANSHTKPRFTSQGDEILVLHVEDHVITNFLQKLTAVWKSFTQSVAAAKEAVQKFFGFATRMDDATRCKTVPAARQRISTPLSGIEISQRPAEIIAPEMPVASMSGDSPAVSPETSEALQLSPEPVDELGAALVSEEELPAYPDWFVKVEESPIHPEDETCFREASNLAHGWEELYGRRDK